MIKIVLFNKSNNVCFLENNLRYNNAEYQVGVYNKENYFTQQLKKDIVSSDVVVLANRTDLIELKRAIRSEFILKNELCRYFNACGDYYFKNSNSDSSELSDFNNCTFPFGFNPVAQGVVSFKGKIGDHNLICLLDDSYELEKSMDLIKNDLLKNNLPAIEYRESPLWTM